MIELMKPFHYDKIIAIQYSASNLFNAFDEFTAIKYLDWQLCSNEYIFYAIILRVKVSKISFLFFFLSKWQAVND